MFSGVDAGAVMARRGDSRELTVTEAQVLEYMMQGVRFRDIGRLLDLKVGTVRRRGQRVYDKLGAGNRVEAVLFAMDMGALHRYGFWGS